MQAKKIRSTFLLFLTAAIWGFAFVAQVIGGEHMGSMTFNALRFFLGGMSLLPVIFVFERGALKNRALIKQSLLLSLGAGVILFIAASLQQYGVDITHSSSKSGFITGLYTVLVPMFSYVFWRKKTTIQTWIGAILCIVGLFLLCMSGETLQFGKGEILLFIGAVFWAFHILYLDYFANTISALIFCFGQFITCALCSAVSALLTETITLSGISGGLSAVLYGGLLSVGVAYTCQLLAQKDADPTFATIVFSTESVFSAIGGALLLHEALEWKNYLGCLLMFAGIVISQLNLKRKSG